MLVLGIETSCDETAAAIVSDAADPRARIRASVVLSQLAEHAPYGGVVPEIAARAHVEQLDGLIRRAMADAGVAFADLDGIAATAGPGLIGGVLVGLMTGKAIALAANKPLLAINHLEGHALTARLTDDVEFPFLLLLVSGGHCQLLSVEGVGRFVRLGTTIDDAAGEAFDKTAKMLGLGYPGGPAVERAARAGNGAKYDLPRPLIGRAGCDFSFSGLKTAVRQLKDRVGTSDPTDVADMAASFQQAVADVVADRVRHAMYWFDDRHPGIGRLVVAGGVAANQALRAALQKVAFEEGFTLAVPPPKLCTDNAAMIAWAGVERLRLGLVDGLDIPARPRWPLDPAAEPRPYAGVKA
jgi:N6-L-threonylcarbamoyladenine synthase